MGKAVTKKNSQQLATIDDSMLLDDAGVGMEEMDQQDLMIPRLSILQSMSPQVNKRDGQYVEGANAGDIFNTVSRTVVSGEKGILAVPIKYRRALIEWKPRASGGGFVRDHGNDNAVLEDCDQDKETFRHITKDGNEIITTAEYYVFIINGSYEPALLSMAGSQLKKARRWNSMTNQLKLMKPDGSGFFNPAMFYSGYQLTTVPEENDKGNWYGWDIEMLHGENGGIIKNIPNGSDIYMAARSFKETIQKGSVKTAPHETPTEEEAF
jgi:hypothetical protein